ncbi:MAG: N-acetylglucosamine-6-phosphate deacetylase [Verrucomicrobia bacterium]|nr:N-acetylglucosamine-6-phosphate deacetylase [Verrucomicrobiota bacterium]
MNVILRMKEILEANVAGVGFCRITVQGEAIDDVTRLEAERPDAPHCSPGFVDLQINGFAGVDFSAPNLEVAALAAMLPRLWATGCTSFCPTLITNTVAQLRQNFATLEQARRTVPGFDASVPCYHLEGPYLSPGPAHGAHDPALMRSPDWAEFETLQRAAGGHIGIVTIAPELPGAGEFIRQAAARGVIVALGHTDGRPEDIHAAVAAGATLSTHLGNGCAAMIDRHLTPLWAQMADDRLHASIICDGFHLPTDVVKVIFRAKGAARTILVTDAVHVALMPPGKYTLVGRGIELLASGKVIASPGQSMAGSALTMAQAVAGFMSLAGATLAEALRAATLTPASLLNRPSVCAKIEPGQTANLVIFHAQATRLAVEAVWLRGRPVFPGETPRGKN